MPHVHSPYGIKATETETAIRIVSAMLYTIPPIYREHTYVRTCVRPFQGGILPYAHVCPRHEQNYRWCCGLSGNQNAKNFCNALNGLMRIVIKVIFNEENLWNMYYITYYINYVMLYILLSFQAHFQTILSYFTLNISLSLFLHYFTKIKNCKLLY